MSALRGVVDLQYRALDRVRHRHASEMARRPGTASDFGAMRGARQCLVVTFKRSGKTIGWDPNLGNLLDLALANGIRIDAGCRAGSCGSCLVAIKSGGVTYINPPDAAPEEGACLTCICRPNGNLELDA